METRVRGQRVSGCLGKLPQTRSALLRRGELLRDVKDDARGAVAAVDFHPAQLLILIEISFSRLALPT